MEGDNSSCRQGRGRDRKGASTISANGERERLEIEKYGLYQFYQNGKE